jgi:ElaB/YqjD/DUF883 family membrane-anchored ribosome-binding protein
MHFTNRKTIEELGMKFGRYILVVFLLASTSSFAQEKIAMVKQRISTHLERIATFQKNAQADSLVKENKVLLAYLEKTLAKDATLMNADMTSLTSMGLHALLSDDGKLKIYQWKTGHKDTVKGTAMYVDRYQAVAAFKIATGIGTTVIQEKAEQEMKYDSLLSVKGTDRTYYLVVSSGMDKIGNKVMKMQAYTIDGTELSGNANIFSSSGSSVSNISIAYSRNSPAPGRMQWNSERQTLAVLSPGNIKKALVYKFDGHTFVQQKAP